MAYRYAAGRDAATPPPLQGGNFLARTRTVMKAIVAQQGDLKRLPREEDTKERREIKGRIATLKKLLPKKDLIWFERQQTIPNHRRIDKTLTSTVPAWPKIG